jgi:hypothetical protein
LGLDESKIRLKLGIKYHKSMGTYNITNVWVTIGDERKIVSEWCKEFGISKQLVNWRVNHGMDLELALLTPVRHWRRRPPEVKGKDATKTAQGLRPQGR